MLQRVDKKYMYAWF